MTFANIIGPLWNSGHLSAPAPYGAGPNTATVQSMRQKNSAMKSGKRIKIQISTHRLFRMLCMMLPLREMEKIMFSLSMARRRTKSRANREP